jgi:hypothetical protein
LADKYRSFSGFVKYEPREGEANGKDVRTIVLRQVGIKDQAIDIRATLWPSHEHVAVEQDDFVAVEGKFTVNKANNKEGEPVTYFNLSVSRIVVLGQGDGGVRADTENTGDADPEDADEEAY